MTACNILFLGDDDSEVYRWLCAHGETMRRTSEPLQQRDLEDVTHIVSHGYRHIIPATLLQGFGNRAVNLHISLLPWNRGADPNFWSFVDDTPKGVSIHVLSAELDKGELLAQRALQLDAENESFSSSYLQLQQAVTELFIEHWPAIKSGTASSESQAAGGSYHASADKQALSALLSDGWDTNIADFLQQLRESRLD